MKDLVRKLNLTYVRPARLQQELDVSNAYIDSDLPTRVQLPTPPRSSQPIQLDMSTLPDNPPFTVYLGNIPFDCSEEEITNFLKQCSVSNVRIPSDTDGRFKGFCYAEVDDLESVRTALSLNDESMQGRRIKVDLVTTDNRDDDRMDQYDDRGGRGGDNQEWGRSRGDGGRGGWDRDRGGPDRRDRPTPDEESTDWRKDQKAPATGGFQDRRGGFNDQGGYNDRCGGYKDRRGDGYDDRRGGGYDDRRGGGYDDRRGGGYDDRRGGYDNRRGYGDDRWGGGYERRGYDDQRGGGYDDWMGGGGGGGYNDRRGGGYDDRRGGDSEDSGEPRRSDPAGGEKVTELGEQELLNCKEEKVTELGEQELLNCKEEKVTELGEQELLNSKEEVARQLKAQGKEEMTEVRVKQEVESPDSGRENAALDNEGKKKWSPSTSSLEHQKMGSSSMERSDEDDHTKCLRLSNESKREHNGSSAPKKAKSKDGLKKARGSSGGSGKQRASSSNTIRIRLKKDLEQKIFMSFSFKDKEKALEINERIKDHFGTCTWICTTDIKPGDILDAKIAEGIHNAKVILCLMSQNFLDSTECEMEIQVARQQKKEFIEVHLEKIRMPRTKSDGKVSSVRLALAPRLYVPLYKDVEGSQEHFEALINGLNGMLASAKH